MTKIYLNLISHCATEIEHLRPYPVNLANVYYVLIWNMYSLFGTTIFLYFFNFVLFYISPRGKWQLCLKRP